MPGLKGAGVTLFPYSACQVQDCSFEQSCLSLMELAAAVINHPGKHLMTRDEEEEKVKHRKWKTPPRAFVSDRFCIYRPSWAKPRISTVGKPSCNCFMC